MRHYGYDNTLQLQESLWNDYSISDTELDAARSFELTKGACDFICGLYRTYEVKGVFDQVSADRVFMASSHGCPFMLSCETVLEDTKS